MSRIKNCQSCGAKAIEISEEDYRAKNRNYLRFISTKYCCECADYFDKLRNKNRQHDYRLRNKEVKKMKEKRISLLDEYARLLREENERYRQQIDELRARR